MDVKYKGCFVRRGLEVFHNHAQLIFLSIFCELFRRDLVGLLLHK